jgi:pimeloyl-ACP methyl ester carboxylesterase
VTVASGRSGPGGGVPVDRRRVRSVEDVEVAVVEVGSATLPAVVVAHGVGSSARFVAAAFGGPLVDAGWRLVTYDLRGHGASTPVREPGQHSLERHVADLDAVVASVAGTVEGVGGVSMGAHAAVRWAATSAWTGGTVLACLPAWVGRAVPGEGAHAAVAAEVREVGVAGVLTRLRADATLPRWLRETLVTDYARHDEDSLAAALVALDGAEAPGPPELAALVAPLGVVAWPDDPGHPLAVARSWCAHAPSARLATLAIDDLEGDLEALGRAALTVLG